MRGKNVGFVAIDFLIMGLTFNILSVMVIIIWQFAVLI